MNLHKKASHDRRLFEKRKEGELEVLLALLTLGGFDKQGAFADAIAEVIEFGAADFATAGDLDQGDAWSVQRENAFDAFTGGNFAHGVGCVDAATFSCDTEAGKDLDTLFTTLDHTGVDFEAVTYFKVGDVFDLLLFDFIDDVHG